MGKLGYKNILIDFDDTIVDFYDAEEWAFHYMANVLIIKQQRMIFNI